MDTLIEILVRGGPLVIFCIAFIAFVYWITQVQPRNAERRAKEKNAGR